MEELRENAIQLALTDARQDGKTSKGDLSEYMDSDIFLMRVDRYMRKFKEGWGGNAG